MMCPDPFFMYRDRDSRSLSFSRLSFVTRFFADPDPDPLFLTRSMIAILPITADSKYQI